MGASTADADRLSQIGDWRSGGGLCVCVCWGGGGGVVCSGGNLLKFRVI